MELLNAMKDIYESVNEDSETAEKLLILKKEIADEIVEELNAKSPDFVVSLGKDLIADYLVDEGFSDRLHDSFVEKGLAALSGHAPKLKELREKLQKASTQEQLLSLKDEVFGPADNESESQDTNLESSSTSASQWEETSPDSNGNTEDVSGEQALSSSRSWVDGKKMLNVVASGFVAQGIHSLAAEKSEKGTTLCAKTARLNAQHFWLNLPAGDAWDIAQTVPKDIKEYKATLPVDKKELRPHKSWSALTIDDFNAMEGVNVADIYPNSKSQYGHRALAFRDEHGEWMVLDPYVKVNGEKDTQPKRLEDYMKTTKVFKWHFFEVKEYRQGDSRILAQRVGPEFDPVPDSNTSYA